MADSILTQNRCSAIIPTGEQDGIECNSPNPSILTESGWRCASCFEQFGGTITEGPDAEFPVHVDPFYRTSAIWRKANIEAQRQAANTPKIRDLGTLMAGVIDGMQKAGIL